MKKIIVFLCCLCLSVSGCAVFGQKTASESDHLIRPAGETLRKTVERYWNFRVKRDLYSCYDYERVAYRKRVTRQYYTSNFGKGIVFKNFRILDIGPEGSGPKGLTPVKLEVQLSYTGLLFPTPESLTQTRLGYWEKEKDGRWYHIISKAGKLE